MKTNQQIKKPSYSVNIALQGRKYEFTAESKALLEIDKKILQDHLKELSI